MILLDTPQVADAAEFFALEYALAVRRSTEEFYFFWQTPPTLMLGRNQVVEQEIDLSAAQRGNVAVRRRNSGGGTIYTDGGKVSGSAAFSGNQANVNGGAIALGHPVGSSGCRIVVTLIHEMKKRGLKYGLATLCIAGGMGQATVIEMCD